MSMFNKVLAVSACLVVTAGAGTARAITPGDRMVGGGLIVAGGTGSEVAFAAELLCPGADVGFDPQPDPPNESGLLELRFGRAVVHLGDVVTAKCTAWRDGGSYEGTGSGLCNGAPVELSWALRDGGLALPLTRVRDEAEFSVRGVNECSFSAGGAVAAGQLRFVDLPHVQTLDG